MEGTIFAVRLKAFRLFIAVLKRNSEGDSITSNFIKEMGKEGEITVY